MLDGPSLTLPIKFLYLPFQLEHLLLTISQSNSLIYYICGAAWPSARGSDPAAHTLLPDSSLIIWITCPRPNTSLEKLERVRASCPMAGHYAGEQKGRD